MATEIQPGPPERKDLDPDTRPLLLAAQRAREAFLSQKRQRQAKGMAWAGLLIVAISPFLGALAFPDRVVAAAPASIVLHDWLGRDVNIYGLAIHRVTVEHLDIDGRLELAVMGDLTNITDSERKVPLLRFGLRDQSHAEVHSWLIDTGVQLLKAGEHRSFKTTLTAPPATAGKVEIRFARADEIGSNTIP